MKEEASLPLFHWRKLRQDEIDHELIWLSTAVGSAVMGYVWLKTGRPLPPCMFHALTGWPCPTCGCTRATFKLLAGDIGAAVAFNPLYILAVCAAVAYCIYAATVLAARMPRLRVGYLSPDAKRRIRWAVITTFLMNWGWLIYNRV